GEGVIRGAVGIARRLGLSELLIGLTLIGFGTSAPELLTSVNAAVSGAPGIALGNVIGSNISNVLLVFGLVALIRPIPVNPAAITRDGLVMIVASATLVAVALVFGELNRPLGAALVALLVIDIITVWMLERRGGPAANVHKGEAHTHDPVPDALWVSALFALGGLGLLVFGADLLVEGAVTLARVAGMSETAIGLTIVAVGTSLPELVATLAAALKGKNDVAFGNIVGSNIYNIFGIVGVTALVKPIAVPPEVSLVDWGVMCLSAVLLLLFATIGRRVTRLEGACLVLLYAAYVAHLLGVLG
ncbi:MAG: calcium/sodium antiporter, partial [Devosia sp.]